jgi:PEGA domain-containing protein
MKKSVFKVVLGSLLLLVPVLPGTAAGSEKSAEKPLLRAAIFVQNRAGLELQNQIEVLNDHLTADLTGKGFSIIDKDVVAARFRESRDHDEAVRNNLKALEEAIKPNASEAGAADALTGASALRMAQMIGADYLVIATIHPLGVETRAFKGENTIYGTNNQATMYTLRIALKLLDGKQGGTVYGDMVTASDRVVTSQNLTINSTDILPKLIDAGARKIADTVAGKVESIRNVKVNTIPVVEFTVTSNVEGATVELDGAAIGSTPGRYKAAPGLHQLRISKEWLSTWERTVNIFQDQSLHVSLELSQEGLRRYATIEQLKLDLARGKQQNDMEMKERAAGIGTAGEQSEAEAFAGKKGGEGEMKTPEESQERSQGPPAENINK